MWILWERRFPDDELMKLVSQEISTSSTAMAIIDSKKWAFRPLLISQIWPIRWLHNVQHNWHPVFIISSYYSLVSINCIAGNFTVASNRAFCCTRVNTCYILLRVIVKCYDYLMSRLQRYRIELSSLILNLSFLWLVRSLYRIRVVSPLLNVLLLCIVILQCRDWRAVITSCLWWCHLIFLVHLEFYYSLLYCCICSSMWTIFGWG